MEGLIRKQGYDVPTPLESVYKDCMEYDEPWGLMEFVVLYEEIENRGAIYLDSSARDLDIITFLSLALAVRNAGGLGNVR